MTGESRSSLMAYRFAMIMCLLCACLAWHVTPASASDARWFVICGSYPESQHSAAMQRMQQLAAVAPDISVLHTTGYANLRDGLFVVALGPYPKAYAMQRLQQMRSYVPDAYVKAGW